MASNPATPSTDAAIIIDDLKAQADSVLSASLGSRSLLPFQIGGLGNFFYNWQDAFNTDLFNQLTYEWISANLRAGASPLQLDASFPNLYIQALSAISWSLSSADQSQLNQAAAKATAQGAALQNAYKQAFNGLPKPGTGNAVNDIATEIATKWADPPTTLTAIKQSTNLNKLLNNVPAAGGQVVPVFVSWLNALGASVSLQNNVTMNNAYLGRALDAVQNPSSDNGGLLLNNQTTVPAYQVTTQVSDIQNSLQSGVPEVKLSMTVSRSTEDQLTVNVSGGASFDIPVADFLMIGVGGDASYFSDNLATTETTTTVEMVFPGVNLVTFQPVPFTMSGASSSWYWIDPIRQAVANQGQDVSGFKFAPVPPIDFSTSGPFGFLEGVAISSYPTITVTTKSDAYQRIQQTFQQSASVSVSFLGIPLAHASESSYSNHVTVDSSSSTVTITLSPPPDLVAGTSNQAQAWVLGVIADYPAA